MMAATKGKKQGAKGAILISILGLILMGADFFTSSRGWELCPYQGCRLAQGSPYAHILGVSLSVVGLAFFFVALILCGIWRKGLLYWSSLGLGASLYFLYLQRWVLGEMCLVCVAVEVLIFLLFLFSLTGVSPWSIISLVLMAFLGLHGVYAWQMGRINPCMGPLEKKILDRYYTVGKGERQVLFFFSVGCPGCVEVLPTVRDWAERENMSLLLREVQVHSEAKEAWALLGLIKGGVDPLKALEEVEKGKGKSLPTSLSKEEKDALIRLMAFNKAMLEAVGMDGVPALMVQREGKVEMVQGLDAIRSLLAAPHALQKHGSSELEMDFGGICTPSGCR